MTPMKTKRTCFSAKVVSVGANRRFGLSATLSVLPSLRSRRRLTRAIDRSWFSVCVCWQQSERRQNLHRTRGANTQKLRSRLDANKSVEKTVEHCREKQTS